MKDNQTLWHGFGKDAKGATPREALEHAGLDWTVEQWPLTAATEDKERGLQTLESERHVMNVRMPGQIPLGVVGSKYEAIQNVDLADFASQLCESGDVEVECAGSVRSGRKVWFLLRGASFELPGSDELWPYLLVSNGHDGSSALRCTPTSIRVTCNNVLHMIRPPAGGKLKAGAPLVGKYSYSTACFSARHTGGVGDKVKEAQLVLGLYRATAEENRETFARLCQSVVTSDAVRSYFIDCYQEDFGTIPQAPESDKDRRRKMRGEEAVRDMVTRYCADAEEYGQNAWTMLNAYTGYLQHDRPKIDTEERIAKVTDSRLFGLTGERGTAAFARALAM